MSYRHPDAAARVFLGEKKSNATPPVRFAARPTTDPDAWIGRMFTLTAAAGGLVRMPGLPAAAA
ncbi:MAG: hypothetical protein ACREFY_07140 [Acetobacteraceae bacterium]